MRPANISSPSRTPTPRLALSKDGRQGACLTQAELLYRALRKRAHTVGEMLALGVSTCPWLRCTEGVHHLRPGERLVKGTRKVRGQPKTLVTYAVKRGC